MNNYEKKIISGIASITQGDLLSVTPGLSLQVVHGGKLKADIKLGQSYKYYDLASLTKIIFTVPVFMSLYDERRIRLNDHISQIIKWWPNASTELGQVLSHSAGLPWWAPFYKKIDLKSSIADRRSQVQKHLSKIKTLRSKKSVYSDLDFILLGFVLEELFAASLHDIWQNLEWKERLSSLHFNLNNKLTYKRNLYAPTEKCLWRKKTLQGEVHDDNTWAFGGVSTHAGIFGDIGDVTRFGVMLRNSFTGKASSLVRGYSFFASNKAAQKFCRRAVPRKQGDWAFGFMLPTKGSASCGKYFSSNSFGHTGFTGTSLWYDPKQDLLVTLLANRVHPTRDNKKFVALRPLIHDVIVKSI